MLMTESWIGVLIAVLWTNAINDFMLRDILWSIVWLRIRGKWRKFRQFKKTVRHSESLISRISMHYLLRHVSKYKSDFVFWWKVRMIFLYIESVLTVFYLIFGLGWSQTVYFRYFTWFMIFHTVPLFIFLVLQYRGGQEPKYVSMKDKTK